MSNSNDKSAFNTIMMVYIGFKVLRMVFSYASLLIAKNFSAQIYMEKVLVNGDNPPALTNLLFLYIIVEVIMVVIFLALLMAVDHSFKLGLLNEEDNLLITYIVPDYIISIMLIISIGTIIGNKMYMKKYFLYKDDGLRAIRAYSEMMLTISILTSIVPFNFMITGVFATVKDKYLQK